MSVIRSSIIGSWPAARTGARARTMRGLLSGMMLGALTASALAPLHTQARSSTDRSLSASLLAVSIPGPVAPFPAEVDSGSAAHAVRFEVDYGRVVPGARIGGVDQLVVLGVRSEAEGSREGGLRESGVFGARVGLRAGDRDAAQAISAWEIYFGGRNLFSPGAPAWLDLGLELAVGWGNLGLGKRASLGLRAPVEMVHESRQARTTIFLAPGMAWGHLRTRGCYDSGPGDNCGDLGIQLAAGRTRFLLGAGAGVTVLPARLSIVAGVQRLFAVGEETRFWLGTAWTQ